MKWQSEDQLWLGNRVAKQPEQKKKKSEITMMYTSTSCCGDHFLVYLLGTLRFVPSLCFLGGGSPCCLVCDTQWAANPSSYYTIAQNRVCRGF